jgi:7-keto-8-aminopelargonate synthetase-like enzyme
MDGDIAPIPEFVRVKKEFGCFLMVDEAHSVCVIGENGGGVDEYFALAPDDIDIKMGTLSKGLGACGGYLAGSEAMIEYLRYALPGFVFSVGISPPLAAATLQSIRLLRSDPSVMERMRRNIRVFMDEACRRGLDTCLAGETAIVPVLVGSDENAFMLSTMLRRNGVFVPPAVYPAVPKNKARLRFCVISDHKPDQIVQALDALERVAAELGIVLPKRKPASEQGMKQEDAHVSGSSGYESAGRP